MIEERQHLIINKYFLFALLILITGLTSAQSKVEKNVSRNNYPDILNIKNIPEKQVDWNAFCFSDMGAWYGFALPNDANKNHYGSFIGPFMMTDGKWLGASVAKLNLYEKKTGNQIDLSKCDSANISYFPGLLKQVIYCKEYKITLELIFVSNKTALQKVNIKNISSVNSEFCVGWSGNVFDDKTKIFPDQSNLKISFGHRNMNMYVLFNLSNECVETNISNEKAYTVKYPDAITLKPEEEYNNTMAFSLDMGDGDKESILKAASALKNQGKYFAENEKRWNGYHSKIFESLKNEYSTIEYKRLAVKSLETLILNWKCAYKDLKHDGLFPSAAIHYFNGFWAWDSWKHAAALAVFAPDIAKDQVRTMFDYQTNEGMVPDVIYADSVENNNLDTKPPLAAWAVFEIYKSDKDINFIKEMYPKLVKYHKWWYSYRDHDANGMCEYGGTVDSLIAAKWESGMDNAIRFDDRKMVKNKDGAYSMDLESVDLNSYLYKEKLVLADMLSILGKQEEAAVYRNEAEALKSKINRMMFDEASGYYYDIDLSTKEKIKIPGPEGWIPLWSGAAEKKEAKAVRGIMMDEKIFNSFVPLGTAAVNNPKLNAEGYWRGPVWFDQAYFGIKGLQNYGYTEEGKTLINKLITNAKGILNDNAPLRENYNPLNGSGLESNHFSWTAAHILLLLWGQIMSLLYKGEDMQEKNNFIHPYIPNTVPHVKQKMLTEIGVSSVDELYNSIPENLRFNKKMNLPDPIFSEYELKKHIEQILNKNKSTDEYISFLGGGCAPHYVPAICDEINHRSEFLTAYAGEPYEDHGRFQTLFEYQSLMAELLDVEVVNVPNFDWGQAASTSIRMIQRASGRNEILVSEYTSPNRLSVITNYCHPVYEDCVSETQ